MSLSINSIVVEATTLLNQKGIDGLTMRDLAQSLNVKAASLYWHIKSKDELLALIAEDICSRIFVDEQINDPELFITRTLGQYRDKLLTVRDSEKIFSMIPPLTPVRKGLIRMILHNLMKLEVPEDKLIQVGHLLNNYVLSFVADETMIKRSNISNDDFYFGLPHNYDFESQFIYGMEILLNGIENTK